MKIVFSDHAKNQRIERKIHKTNSEVIKTGNCYKGNLVVKY